MAIAARAALVFAVVVAIPWMTSEVVHTQVIRLAGTLKDEAGRPVKRAAVVAENPDNTPPRLTSTSNDKGQFGFIGMRRGTWTITVDAPGFEKLSFTRQVTSGRQAALDVRMSATALPAALPLDGVDAADIQRRIDRAEAFAANNDLDAAIAAWREVLAKVPALTTVSLEIAKLEARKCKSSGKC